jgi:hypothetical protein
MMKEETAENEQRKNNGVVKKTQRALRQTVAAETEEHGRENGTEECKRRELGRQKTDKENNNKG